MRSAYSTNVRFFADDDGLTRITWYKVPNDRPFLPVASAWKSWNWENENGPRSNIVPGQLLQGEYQDGNRAWSNGTDPTGTVFNGRYCGSADQWAAGDSMRLPPDPPLAGDCCLHSVVTCPGFTGPSPMTLTVVIAGLDDFACGDCKTNNGTWTLTRVAPCTWRGSLGTACAIPVTFQLTVNPDASIAAGFSIDGAAYMAPGPWDGSSPLVLTFIGGGIGFFCMGYPPTLTVTVP